MTVRSSVYVTDAEVQAVLSACRVLAAVSARSALPRRQEVDPVQFRALVIISAGRAVTVDEVAAVAGLNRATADRVCDRMVHAGLVTGQDEADRYPRRLRLTNAGRDVVSAGVGRRREALEVILGRLPVSRRLEFVAVLREFCDAGTDEATLLSDQRPAD